MGVLANGFIGATGVFQTWGATVLNNAYPSTTWANFARTGAARNITAGEGINSGLVSLPSGNRHPSAWMMPQKPGALAARNSVTGEGGVTEADTWAVKLAQAALTLALVTPFGNLIYRLAYESLADATVLVLLIVSVGVHFALVGLGLLFFGAEGFRNPSFWDARFSLGALSLSGQTIFIFLASAALIVSLWLFFERTLRGKALRATAVNQLGARLMGISTRSAGRLSFTMAAFIGALSGLLIGPTTTIFYDSGFIIGLKGFVAAVFAGLASYPLALVGALGVGLIESFGSFWASAFKEVIVFGAILPVLLWRSLRDPHSEEH